jgi:hypothetical protein
MKTQIATLRASAAQAGAGTVNGTPVKFQHPFREAMILLDVTAAATEADDTLDVYIDTSPDGGTTWINVGHFTQVLGNGGAKKFVMALRADNPGTSAVTNVTSDAAAGATRQYGIADRLRYRGVVVDPTGSNASFTYAVTAFLK